MQRQKGRICKVHQTVPNKKVPGLHVIIFTRSLSSLEFLPVTSLSHCDSIANPAAHCSCHTQQQLFFISAAILLPLLAVWESLFIFFSWLCNVFQPVEKLIPRCNNKTYT